MVPAVSDVEEDTRIDVWQRLRNLCLSGIIASIAADRCHRPWRSWWGELEVL